jgi:glutathione synthase
MQRIFPKPQTSIFLRKGQVSVLPSISELGVYGVFLGDGSDDALLNANAGYLLRTKPDGVDEGGVATGYSVLSSILLDNYSEPQMPTD